MNSTTTNWLDSYDYFDPSILLSDVFYIRPKDLPQITSFEVLRDQVDLSDQQLSILLNRYSDIQFNIAISLDEVLTDFSDYEFLDCRLYDQDVVGVEGTTLWDIDLLDWIETRKQSKKTVVVYSNHGKRAYLFAMYLRLEGLESVRFLNASLRILLAQLRLSLTPTR